MTVVDALCTICKKTDEPFVLVTDKGFDGLLKYSKERIITPWRRGATVFRSRFMKRVENDTAKSVD